MSGMIDWRCKCGKRYGWAGGVMEALPCPRCGAQPEPDELAAAEAELRRFRDEILAERARKGEKP